MICAKQITVEINSFDSCYSEINMGKCLYWVSPLSSQDAGDSVFYSTHSALHHAEKLPTTCTQNSTLNGSPFPSMQCSPEPLAPFDYFSTLENPLLCHSCILMSCHTHLLKKKKKVFGIRPQRSFQKPSCVRYVLILSFPAHDLW